MKSATLFLSMIAACSLATFTLSQTAVADEGTLSDSENPAGSQYEVQCAPFVHAQGTIMQVKILRASDEAEVTIGAPSFNVPTTTQSYPIVQKISDTHGRTVNYQATNFVLTVDKSTFTAKLHIMFQGQEKIIENLVCQN